MFYLVETQFAILSQGRVVDLSQGFNMYGANSGSTGLMLAGISLLCIIVAIVIHAVVKRRAARKVNDPIRLFKELCSANKLSRYQRKLLRKMAAAKKLKDPTTLFVDPTLWLIQPGTNRLLNKPATIRQIMQIHRGLFPQKATDPRRRSAA